MLRILGLIGVVVLGLVLALNGAIMLVSPRTWFRMPSWLAFRGSLTEKRFGSGWGALQVRLAGAMFVALIASVTYDSLVDHRAAGNGDGLFPPRLMTLLLLVAASIGIVNGALMLVAPRAWSRLPGWIRAQHPPPTTAASPGPQIYIRFLGAIMLAFCGWALYALVRP